LYNPGAYFVSTLERRDQMAGPIRPGLADLTHEADLESDSRIFSVSPFQTDSVLSSELGDIWYRLAPRSGFENDHQASSFLPGSFACFASRWHSAMLPRFDQTFSLQEKRRDESIAVIHCRVQLASRKKKYSGTPAIRSFVWFSRPEARRSA
jgi:hypothetical protein